MIINASLKTQNRRAVAVDQSFEVSRLSGTTVNALIDLPRSIRCKVSWNARLFWTSDPRSFILRIVANSMTDSYRRTPSKKGLTPFGVIGFIIGLALFAYFVKKAGVGQIIEGISRLGAGFILVIAVSALRQIARSLAWTLCMESPYKLRFRDAFRRARNGRSRSAIFFPSPASSSPNRQSPP
jgi:hypothetical protein